ncbi:hypothetical protein TorRG33x02_321750 [Trema orientale]|uniref:Transmembrane protein n=1 Tax=Trema orientale TaxID=63057 RepID=A0A2P5BGN6_TREOI|nr:hypothetical protein TorRG33x02_321750 [Trema orientale]
MSKDIVTSSASNSYQTSHVTPSINDQSNNSYFHKADMKEPEEINTKQEAKLHSLEAKALHLSNVYFVFQGVILSTIATIPLLRPDHLWIPFALSLLAAILKTAALCHTISAFVKCSE